MKIFILQMLIVFSHACIAQPTVIKLDNNFIPKAIKYNGHIISAVRWTDSLGDNIVLTTETGETKSKSVPDDDYRDAALYAYHYLAQGDSLKLTWKVYDFTKDCPVEIRANFINNTFAVTDLNNDGKAEVWLMYRTVCHGDVSPSNMKIIMYEGDKKFAIRGMNRVRVSANESVGGKYSLDDAFKKAPEVFRQYATRLWNENIMETWK
jgi:hypothetical protein